MSAHAAPTRPRLPLHVQVGSALYEGVYRTQSGVLTVWYGSTEKSVALRPGPPEFQAELLLVDLVMRATDPKRYGPDPRD